MPGKADYVYAAYLNDRQILASLLRIEKNMQGLERKGDDAFKKIESSGGRSLGAVGQIGVAMATQIVNAFVNMGKKAVQTIGQIVTSTRDAAAEFDVTRNKFISIFKGNEKFADATIDHIMKKATELGLELNEAMAVTRSFVPDVKGMRDPIAEIDKIMVAVRGLAQEDPAQGIIGARFALDEAMSGSLRSLRARFEFTKAEVDILKQAQVDLGDVAGTIEGINKVLERRGFSVEALEGTYTQAVNEMTAVTSKFQLTMGDPIVEEWTEQLNGLLDIFKENEQGLVLFADALGRVIASIVEFVGENLQELLSSLTSEQAIEMAEALFGAVEAAKALITVLTGAEWGGDFVESITYVATKMEEILVTATKIGAMAKATIAQRQAEETVREEQGLTAAGGFVTFAGTEAQEAEQVKAGQEAYKKVIQEATQALFDMEYAKDKNSEATANLRAELNKETDATLESANAFLAAGDIMGKVGDKMTALQDLMAEGVTGEEKEQVIALTEELHNMADALDEAALEKAAEAAELWEQFAGAGAAGQRDLAVELRNAAEGADEAAKAMREEAAATREAADAAAEAAQTTNEMIEAQEKLAQIQKQYTRKVEDIHKNHARKLADLDEELAEKRVDLAKKNAREIEDIYEKHEEDVAAEALDWEREKADMVTAHARQRTDNAKEASKKRVQVEENYHKKILDVNRRFAMQLEDAEEAQDALAFIAAVKARERAVDEAKLEREQARSETETGIAERNEQLATQQAREAEDARIGHERQLQDLQIRLEQELQAQAQAHEREIADLVVLEERKRDEIQKWLDRQMEDAEIARQRKIDDLMEGLDEEVQAFLEAEMAKTAIQEEETAKRIALLEAEMAKRAEAALMAKAAHEPTPEEMGPGGKTPLEFEPVQIPIFQKGGSINKGQMGLVGEHGPELFVPSHPGKIIPNNELANYMSRAAMGGGNTYNFSPQYALNNPAVLTPEQAAATQQIAETVSIRTMSNLYRSV